MKKKLAALKREMQRQEIETRKAYERWPQSLPDKWSTPERPRRRAPRKNLR